MSSNTPQTIGKRGEDYVCQQLTLRGWKVLQRNYRSPFAELDIVAKDPHGNLAIVEVKTRTSFSWLGGYDCIGRKQLRRRAQACLYLGERNSSSHPARLDLALVKSSCGQIYTMELLQDLELSY
jgi:putative endonuclease